VIRECAREVAERSGGENLAEFQARHAGRGRGAAGRRGARAGHAGRPGAALPYRFRSARTNRNVPTIVKTRKNPIVTARSRPIGCSTAAAYSGLPQ
jgi:hypothetical protein